MRGEKEKRGKTNKSKSLMTDVEESPWTVLMKKSVIILMVEGRTWLFTFHSIQGVAVQTEGKQCPQQANRITVCTTLKLWRQTHKPKLITL